MVYNRGLKVYTTLDLKKQRAAQKVMEEGLARQTQISGQLLSATRMILSRITNRRLISFQLCSALNCT
jgi:membrane carboxypeptidase/penicillin-binding protein